MTYSVRKLITNAYYLSSKVARQLENVSGDEIADGLEMLNDFLSVKTANRRLIPYYELIEFPLVAGQTVYFVENLVEIVSTTFNIDTVRFPMMEIGRRDFFGSGRVDNVQALPFTWHMERVKGGTNIHVYFPPQAAYPFKVMGKFSLTNITNLGLDLETIMDRFYITYMRYGLAEYICNEFALPFPPESRLKLAEFEATIQDLNPIDFTMTKLSSFTGQGGLSWGQVNLGRGWNPA